MLNQLPTCDFPLFLFFIFSFSSKLKNLKRCSDDKNSYSLSSLCWDIYCCCFYTFLLLYFYMSWGGMKEDHSKINRQGYRGSERQDNLKSDSSTEDSGSLSKHILFSSSYPQASNNYKTLNYVYVLCKDVYKVLSFVIRKYMARNDLNCVDSTNN